MSKYTDFIIPTPCSEICPALIESEAFSNAYRKLANDAIDYLLQVYHAQRGGQLGEVDGERVTLLLDTLLSLEKTDKGGK